MPLICLRKRQDREGTKKFRAVKPERPGGKDGSDRGVFSPVFHNASSGLVITFQDLL
jgi:hypothetical protein